MGIEDVFSSSITVVISVSSRNSAVWDSWETELDLFTQVKLEIKGDPRADYWSEHPGLSGGYKGRSWERSVTSGGTWVRGGGPQLSRASQKVRAYRTWAMKEAKEG